MAYSTERHAAVLRKMEPPNAVPLRQLARDEGIAEATLHKWRKAARGKGQLLRDAEAGPEGWTSRDKFAAVIETAAMNEADLAVYCRQRGIYAEQIQAWRAACEQANDWERASAQRLGQASREEKKRIKTLERDLARKGSGHWPERSGRGGSASGPQKKRRGDLGGRRGRMISTPDRQNAIALIEQANAAGARRDRACAELGIDERSCRRWRTMDGTPADRRPTAPRPMPRNKLSEEERQAVLDTCNSKAFESLPPSQIVPRLADQGRYIASEASFYRILRAEGQQHHRGRARPPARRPPPTSHRARGPCEVWSWDITWMPGPIRGVFFYLYLMLDIFSCKIVGWEVQERESAELAAELVHKAVWAEGCVLRPLVLHADNGSPMKGATMKATLERLGVIASYSRPRVSDDNPFSEALFRTCKYRPEWPRVGFASKDDAQRWVGSFVSWYNNQHHHSAIRFVTPDAQHTGQERRLLDRRAQLTAQARAANPTRWSRQIRNWSPIGDVCLNPERNTNAPTISGAA